MKGLTSGNLLNGHFAGQSAEKHRGAMIFTGTGGKND